MKFKLSRKSLLSLKVEGALIPLIKEYCHIEPDGLKNLDAIRIKVLELCDLIDVGKSGKR